MGIAPDGKDFHFNIIPVLKSALLVLDSQVAMSPNANVFIIFAMSLFLSVHEFLRETWQSILVPPFLDCGQYSQVVSSLFSRGWNSFCRVPWLAGLAERWETEFLLCYQLSAVSCSESEPQGIHL